MIALAFHALVAAAMTAALVALLLREMRGCDVCGCVAPARCGCVCHRRRARW